MASHDAPVDPCRLILTPTYTLVFKGSFPSISHIFILHPPLSSGREAAPLQEPNLLTNAPRRSGWDFGVVIQATYRIGESGMATEGDAYGTSLNGTRNADARLSFLPCSSERLVAIGHRAKLRARAFCEFFAQQQGVFQASSLIFSQNLLSNPSRAVHELLF